jgi:23S rRNA pseudouridine2605 synthase
VSDQGQRLQKILAAAGVGSRRQVESLIVAGRVAVNGQPATLGRRIDPSKDAVEVDGSLVPLDTRLVYYLLNKPRGVITTARDPQGRPSVLDLVELGQRVWPVGRLDADTEGALLLTNDGEITRRLTHPSFEVPKRYVAEVTGHIGRQALRTLARGVPLGGGLTAPAQVALIQRRRRSSLVEITLTEGRNRQVRRMLDHVGHPAVRLTRTAIGPLMLGHLRAGNVRRLGLEEVTSLYRSCEL